MKRKYPTLIEFRKEGESWKHLFIRTIKDLSTLWEKYQIPYIPTKGCSPERLLQYKTKSEIYDGAMICAVAGDNVNLVKYFLGEKRVEIGYRYFNYASNYGSLKVMDYGLLVFESSKFN
jgi:hypothetical protein